MTEIVSCEKLRRYFLGIIEQDYELGLVKRPEVPSDDYLKAYYTQRQFPRIHYFLNTFFQNQEKSKILSVGCGGAAYMEIYLEKELGHSVIGADLKSTILDWNKRNAERNLRMVPCNIDVDELPFADNQFDVVIFAEVLEHLRGIPDVALRRLHRVLVKDGRLLLSTPNVAKIGNIAALISGQNIYPVVDEKFFQIDGAVGHFREYSMDQIRNLLKRNGFQLKSIFLFSPYRTMLAKFMAISYYLPKLRDVIMVEALKKTRN